MSDNKITTPQELRATLLASIEKVIQGQMTVHQANAVANLSSELHKSIKQDFELRIYAAKNMTIESGDLKKLLEM